MGSKEKKFNIDQIKNILVAVDFFEPSTSAFHYGVQFAKEFSAQLTVFHHCGTYGQEFSDYAMPYMEQLTAPALPPLRELAQKEMQNFLAQYAPKDLSVKTEFGQGQWVAGEILEVAKRNQTDLLIVGTHGKTGFDRFLLGSVAEKIIRRSPIPVLIVRGGQMPKGKDLYDSLKRMVIATDFSEHSEYAVEQGLNLAKRLSSEVELIHAVDPHVLLPFRPFADHEILEGYKEKLQKQAHSRFKEYLERFTDSEDFLDVQVLAGKPFEVVLESCQKFSANLAILGSHGHHRMENVFLGSTAERVAQRIPCPLLIIK